MSASAGILVYRKVPHLEVLLAHPGGPYWTRKDVGAWSIPKGEIDDEEDAEHAARREFIEETGSDVPGGPLLALGSIMQRSGKVVWAWAVEGDLDATSLCSNTFEMEWPPRSGKRATFPEVDRFEWFDVATACERINPAQMELIERLNEAL